MREETILYYVMPKKKADTALYEKQSIKKSDIWRKLFPKRQSFPAFEMQDGGRSIIAVVLPEEAEKWKPEKLIARMRDSLKCHPQTDRILMQPAVEKLLGASDTFLECREELTEELLVRFMLENPGNVVLLLGDVDFPERQLDFFGKLLTPYLPRINRMTVLYADGKEADGDAQVDGADRTYQIERILYATEVFGGELYYEYGLVVQAESIWNYAKRRRKEDGRVLYLDGGSEGRMPAYSLKKGDLYLDMVSSTILKTRIERLNIDICYLSPRKYLDTIVKSGYDI